MSEAAGVLPKLIRVGGAFVRHPIQTSFWAAFKVMERMIRSTRLGKVTFYPTDALPWAKPLEAGWRDIRAELDGVLADLRSVPNVQDEYAGQYELTQDDKWKSFTLVRGGRHLEENCVRCPKTAALLKNVPQLSNAFFSIMAGHKHLKAHCGPYAGVLNCHLGLKMPPDPTQCRIRVLNDIRHWEEGRLTVFDERYEHEVWNDSDHIRVVMIMYVLRPLPWPISTLNWLLVVLSGVFLKQKAQ